MKASIVALGILVGAWAAMQGYACYLRAAQQGAALRVIQEKIMASEKKMSALSVFPRRTAQGLDEAYMALVNDIDVLARTHGAGCALTVRGAGDSDVPGRAVPWIWEGLREIRLQAVFSMLTHEIVLLSLGEGFDSLEKTLPVMVQSMVYEDDRLVVEFSVIGL
jgi:hypothetical protein